MTMPFSVYLGEAIRARITFADLIEPVEEAFKDYSRKRSAGKYLFFIRWRRRPV